MSYNPTTPRFQLYFLCIAFICSSFFGFSQDSYDSKFPLFASDEPIKVTIYLDIKKTKNDVSDDPQYHEGKLVLYNSDADSTELDVKIKPRGHSRRVFDFCTFPPIKVNFKKKQVAGTVFDGQDKLKLVAYCRDMDQYEEFVLKEYLIYKMYNLFTTYSFKVRLAEVTYKDLDGKGKVVTRYGFFIEDEDMLAKRNGGTITESLMSNHDRCDRSTLDQLTVFQYMIGNTDWWIAKPKIHNIKLIATDEGSVVPVPYDFDYSGAVSAKYAVPHDDLPIQSVRERYFRGYCRFAGTYEEVVDGFNDRKELIYELLRSFERLPEKQAELVIKYLEGFYKEVNNPKTLQRNIYNACELSHKHLHKTVKVNK